MKFNEKLIKLRKAQGMSQEDLGYELNVTRQTISKWELGESTPEMEKLIQISNYFGVSVDELVSNSEEVTNQNNNKEYVGIDEKYIPNDVKNDSSYVNNNKVSKKVLAIPIVVVVIPILVFIITAVIIVSKIKPHVKKGLDMVENVMDKSTEVMDKSIETVDDINQKMKNEIEAGTEEQQHNEKYVEAENFINGIKAQQEEDREKFNKQQEEFDKKYQEVEDSYNNVKEKLNL